MIRLHFKKSTSKKYKDAMNLSLYFKNLKQGEINVISLPIKEIFEKWENFNNLFWIIVDWKGVFIEMDGMEYHSHTDKTRIFYSLQFSHAKWMNYIELKTSRFFHNGEFNNSLDMTEKDADYLIDLYSMRKSQKEAF